MTSGRPGEVTSASDRRWPNVRSLCLSSSASGWSFGKPDGTRVNFSPPIWPNVATNPGSSMTVRGPLGVLGDGLPERRQLGRRRMPHPAPDVDLAGSQVEVAARVAALAVGLDAALGPRERGRDVRLVRRLVLREADVAVDPERRAGRIGRRAGCRASRNALVEGDAQRLERPLEQPLVLGLARREPRPVVVLGQVDQEIDRLGSEAGEGVGRRRHRRVSMAGSSGLSCHRPSTATGLRRRCSPSSRSRRAATPRAWRGCARRGCSPSWARCPASRRSRRSCSPRRRAARPRTRGPSAVATARRRRRGRGPSARDASARSASGRLSSRDASVRTSVASADRVGEPVRADVALRRGRAAPRPPPMFGRRHPSQRIAASRAVAGDAGRSRGERDKPATVFERRDARAAEPAELRRARSAATPRRLTGRPAACSARTPVTTNGTSIGPLADAHARARTRPGTARPRAPAHRPAARSRRGPTSAAGSARATRSPRRMRARWRGPLAPRRVALAERHVAERPARHLGRAPTAVIGHRLPAWDIGPTQSAPAHATIAEVACITWAQCDCSIESA